ncbi:NAD(P)H-dependent oxidoreductase [Bacillus sp. 3255]|uniref:NAD(P)H-dependent oxidoreductase n=1 Tax=Bacillus sp. 3255 TaxID=2817904 RepID=UPI00285D0D8E|nr:NAD(P)H-dependent oxidoreductase [Bacillus sp. 3255]MDR6879456.1 glutathione-regulated potassium-efflux system ancillary protein KefG [Bacillus sp. 3255]
MNIMVIAAHPNLVQSRANKTLLQELNKYTDIHVRALYQEYPTWQIDVEKEQRMLQQFDRIVLQFPFYWYSCPPLLKKWFDDVLTFGWAFGPGGEKLLGKEFMIATTTGGTEPCYRSGGENLYTISELLRPIERTLTKCNGTFLPAFVMYDVVQATDIDLAHVAEKYAEFIKAPRGALIH